MEMKNQLDESDADLLQLAIVELRTRFDSPKARNLHSIPSRSGLTLKSQFLNWEIKSGWLNYQNAMQSSSVKNNLKPSKAVWIQTVM
jgi:hypothetical protein